MNTVGYCDIMSLLRWSLFSIKTQLLGYIPITMVISLGILLKYEYYHGHQLSSGHDILQLGASL